MFIICATLSIGGENNYTKVLKNLLTYLFPEEVDVPPVRQLTADCGYPASAGRGESRLGMIVDHHTGGPSH